jgi:hypothetical protein
MVMPLSCRAIPPADPNTYYSSITNQRVETLKTIELSQERVTIEFTEFELMALAALVERAQAIVPVKQGDQACIREAIHTVADEFKSLLGHFELAA